MIVFIGYHRGTTKETRAKRSAPRNGSLNHPEVRAAPFALLCSYGRSDRPLLLAAYRAARGAVPSVQMLRHVQAIRRASANVAFPFDVGKMTRLIHFALYLFDAITRRPDPIKTG
jgi:hypothetical protein